MKNNVRNVRDLRKSRFRRRKRIVSYILILAMIFAVMPNSAVRADGIDINKDSESVWSDDGFGGRNYDIPTGTYGSIVIPATTDEGEYHLTIAGTEVTATSVEIQSGATLHIFDTESQGRLTSTTITAQDGARMELGSSSNIPEGIQVYDIFYDEESGENSFVDISEDGEWGWFTFVYVEEENKWIVEPNEYDSFGGTEDKPVVIEAAIFDYEGEGFPIHFPDTISEDDTIDGGDKMKARVSTETTSIELSWDAVNTPNQICVDGAGENGGWLIHDVTEEETSYTLELNQDDRDFYYVEFKYGDVSGETGSEELSYNFERLQSELDQTYFAFGRRP